MLSINRAKRRLECVNDHSVYIEIESQPVVYANGEKPTVVKCDICGEVIEKPRPTQKRHPGVCRAIYQRDLSRKYASAS
jgi:formylmethanofuran dehydrogenase subunit E